MHFSSACIALAALSLVAAAPIRSLDRRAEAAPDVSADVLVFKFADVLEQFESQYYQQVLGKFKDADFLAAGFSSSTLAIEQFTVMGGDEQTHSQALQEEIKALGSSPITSCQFDFSSVLTDLATAAATARVVENVGVGAYLGGATLLTDPVLLDLAGSILTIEARHQTIHNVLAAGTAIPSAFDIPLAPNEVLAIAGPFISGCDVGIPANPSLSVTNTGTVQVGTQLSFKSAAINGSVPESQLFCQMLIGGAPFSIALPFNNCVVPSGINGPVAIFITSDGQPLVNNVRDRAKDKLIAGPTLAFIDSHSDLIGQVDHSGSSGNGSGNSTDSSSSSSSSGNSTGSGDVSNVSTETISPGQASSIIASADATTSVSATSTSAGGAATTTSSTSTTDTAAGSSPTGSTDSAASSDPGQPDTSTGPSGDGSVTVNGWSNV